MSHDFKNQFYKYHRKTITKSPSQQVATIVSAGSDWSRDGCDFVAVDGLTPCSVEIIKYLGII